MAQTQFLPSGCPAWEIPFLEFFHGFPELAPRPTTDKRRTVPSQASISCTKCHFGIWDFSVQMTDSRATVRLWRKGSLFVQFWLWGKRFDARANFPGKYPVCWERTRVKLCLDLYIIRIMNDFITLLSKTACQCPCYRSPIDQASEIVRCWVRRAPEFGSSLPTMDCRRFTLRLSDI